MQYSDIKFNNHTITSNGSVTITACGTYTWPANGQVYTFSTTDTFVTGCNTATLDLTITTSISPTGDSFQNFPVVNSNDATIANIVVSPSNVIWYASLADAQNGVNALPTSTIITTGLTYFAVNVTSGCPSNPFAVTVTVTLRNNDFDDLNFSYYPNPTVGILNISYSNEISEVSLINLLGQLIFTEKTNATAVQIDLSRLPTATYMVKVISENKVKIVKVIKK